MSGSTTDGRAAINPFIARPSEIVCASVNALTSHSSGRQVVLRRYRTQHEQDVIQPAWNDVGEAKAQVLREHLEPADAWQRAVERNRCAPLTPVEPLRAGVAGAAVDAEGVRGERPAVRPRHPTCIGRDLTGESDRDHRRGQLVYSRRERRIHIRSYGSIVECNMYAVAEHFFEFCEPLVRCRTRR